MYYDFDKGGIELTFCINFGGLLSSPSIAHEFDIQKARSIMQDLPSASFIFAPDFLGTSGRVKLELTYFSLEKRERSAREMLENMRNYSSTIVTSKIERDCRESNVYPIGLSQRFIMFRLSYDFCLLC